MFDYVMPLSWDPNLGLMGSYLGGYRYVLGMRWICRYVRYVRYVCVRYVMYVRSYAELSPVSPNLGPYSLWAPTLEGYSSGNSITTLYTPPAQSVSRV
jgi:hypothetical protein